MDGRHKNNFFKYIILVFSFLLINNLLYSFFLHCGSGTGSISPSHITPGSTNKFTILYTSMENITNGAISVEIPSGFSAPQTNNPNIEGYVTFSQGIQLNDVSITGSGPWTIEVTIRTMQSFSNINIYYGANTNAVAPSQLGFYTFAMKSKVKNTGTLISLFPSPGVQIQEIDGSGSMGLWDGLFYAHGVPLTVSTKSTQEYKFEYFSSFQLNGGAINLEIPIGFTPPQMTDSNQPGFVSLSNAENVVIDNLSITGAGPWQINITIKTMQASSQLYIKYGKNKGSRAPSVPGYYGFNCKSKKKNGFLTPLYVQPSVIVKDIDGSGSLLLNERLENSILTKSTQQYIFKYSSEFKLNKGMLSINIPTGFSAPQTNSSALPGYVSLTNGNKTSLSNLSITGTGPWMINVCIKTMAAINGYFYVKYGKGLGTVAPTSVGTYTFTAKSRNENGNLAPLEYSPIVKLKNKDGSGAGYFFITYGMYGLEMTNYNLKAGSVTNLILNFTSDFNLNHGAISLEIPSGFSAPQTNDTGLNGYISISNSSGTVISNFSISNRIINISVKTLNKDGSIIIHYTNVQIPSTAGKYFFNFKSREAGGTLTSIDSSPYAIVFDSNPPSPVMTVSAQDNPSDNGRQLLVKWSNPNTNPDFFAYNIYLSDSPITATTTSFISINQIYYDASVKSTIISVPEDLIDYYVGVKAVDAGNNSSSFHSEGLSTAGPVYSVRNVILSDFINDTIYSTYDKNTKVIFKQGENIGSYLDIIQIENESSQKKVDEANLKATIKGLKFQSMDQLSSTIGHFIFNGNFFGTAELYMNYADSDLANIKENKLKLLKLDENENFWFKVKNQTINYENKYIKTDITGFSIFRIAEIQVADDLSNVKIYPNPFKPTDDDFSTGNYNTGIKFINLPPMVKIKIYNIAGEYISTLNESDGDGILRWNATNDDGDKLASGLYILYIENIENKKDKVVKRLAIIK